MSVAAVLDCSSLSVCGIRMPDRFPLCPCVFVFLSCSAVCCPFVSSCVLLRLMSSLLFCFVGSASPIVFAAFPLSAFRSSVLLLFVLLCLCVSVCLPLYLFARVSVFNAFRCLSPSVYLQRLPLVCLLLFGLKFLQIPSNCILVRRRR